MVDNPPDELSSQKYYAEEPAGPAPPVNLDRWHTELRRAIIAMRRSDRFGIKNHSFSLNTIMLSFMIKPELTLGVIPALVVFLIVSYFVESHLFRRYLNGADLIDRLLSADPTLAPCRTGYHGRKASRQQEETAVDLAAILDKLNLLVSPPSGDFLHRYSGILTVAVICLFAVVVILMGMNWYSAIKIPENALLIIFGIVLAVDVIAAYNGGRSWVRARIFCSELSRRMGSDLVFDTGELSLGTNVFLDRLQDQRELIHQTISMAMLVAGAIGLISTVIAVMLTLQTVLWTSITAALSLVVYGIIIFLCAQEASQTNRLIKPAVQTSAISLKLIAGEYRGEQFRQASKWTALLFRVTTAPDSIIRSAFLVSQELENFAPISGTLNYRRWILAISATLLVLFSVLIYMQPGDSISSIGLLIPVFTGLGMYLLLSAIVQSGTRGIAVLECLKQHLEENLEEQDPV